MKFSIRDIVRRERWATAFEDEVTRWVQAQEEDGVRFVVRQLICAHPGYNLVIRLDDEATA